MLRRLLQVLFSVALLGNVSVQGADAIALPEDPSVPVAELWYVQDGLLGPPEVAIFANGRVQVRVGQGSLWGDLSREQLESLINCLLKRDHLSELNSAELENAIKAESIRTGLSSDIRGAADTIIRVRTAKAVYRVDGHAVGLLCTRFPNIEGLQDLYAAQRRMENIRAVIMVGGAPAAERLAQVAQSKLLSESGERIAVGSENLSCVHSLTDGTLCCQFVVPSQDSVDAPPRIISLFESPGEAPRVSVLPDGSTLR
ncbi:hypothetical protein SH661x_003611 [Planctomicrobium sp. SH661]|uniref:hypothetical protein n=1 Tax=Planctomicrobium sp. SH661 TaxID=3448124 RepID=UPI003F5C2AA8